MAHNADTSNLPRLEIAILQVVNALCYKGRPMTPHLKAVKRHIEGLKAALFPEKPLDVSKVVKDGNGPFPLEKDGYSYVPVGGGRSAMVRRQPLFHVGSVPEVVIQAELSFHGLVILDRLELALAADIEGLVQTRLRALCVEGMLRQEGYFMPPMETAYIRPDGSHVYMDISEARFLHLEVYSRDLIEDPDALDVVGIPGTGGGHRLTVDRDSWPIPGYVLTAAGRAAIKGLPELLDPAADFPNWNREPLGEDGGSARAGSGTMAPKRWEPPPGYVSVSTIMNDKRFRKNEKNPPRTTIDEWVRRDERLASKERREAIRVQKAPDNQEVHLPEVWVHEQIRRWCPRRS